MSGDIDKTKKHSCDVSQFKIHLENGFHIFLHSVSVMLILNGKSKNLCKTGKYIDKKRCKEAVEKAMRGRSFVYNNQEMLYLFNDSDSNLKTTIEDAFGEFEVTIAFFSKIEIKNVKAMRTFLNTALNQHPINLNKFSFVGNGESYAVANDDTCEAKIYEKYGLVIRHGNQKGVHFINNNTDAILTMDYKKSVFYPGNANFLQVVKTCISNKLSYNQINELYKNIVVQVKHRPWQYFRFQKFTEEKVKDLQVENQSMIEYFQQNDINVDGEYKAVQCNPICIYPLETLILVPDQKVSKDNLCKFGMDKKSKKLSAGERLEAIKDQYQKMEFNNPLLEEFGIKVSTDMIKAEYYELPLQKIIGGENEELKPKNDGSFLFYNFKYFKISSIENLFIFGCSKQWKNILERQLKNVNIKVKKIDYETKPSDVNSFEGWKQKLSNNYLSNDYVIVITKTKEIHDLLNFLKIKTGIKIQHILEKTTTKNCIQNIVHKFNVKAGSFNWKVNAKMNQKLDLNSVNRHTIVIGSDVCRPKTKNQSKHFYDKAACVGNSSNSEINPFRFEESFFYQKAGEEIITSKESNSNLFFQEIIEIFKKFSSNKEADIIYARDGVSETQYQEILDIEIPILKAAAKEYFGLTKFKILALIVTKSGNTRFFDTSEKGKTQNLPPRSVITIGNRDHFEQFHLIPHHVESKYATTKPLMITVLLNEVKAEMKEIQNFLIVLCNLHQYNCGPIGLPAPIFLADKIAYKGYRMLSSYEKYVPKKDWIKEDCEDFYKHLTQTITKRLDAEESATTENIGVKRL